MGLAASQARLLTLTSRLSSIELKQQMIANAKILLANDSEEVSTKYTKALNNQTLLMADGTNEVELTYSNLTAAGYSIKKTGDGTFAKNGTVIDGVQKPSVPRPENYASEKPTLDLSSLSGYKGQALTDAKNWKNTALSKAGEYPKTITTSMNDLLKNNNIGAFNLNAFTSGNSFNTSLSYKSLDEIANPANGVDYVVVLAQDGGKVGGYPDTQAKNALVNIGNQLITKIATALNITTNTDSGFKTYMETYLNELKNNINFNDRNRERDTNTAYFKAVNEARNGLVGNLTETYKKGCDNDGYFLNLSEMVRRLTQKAFSYYDKFFQNPTSAVLNQKADTSQMNRQTSITLNSRGYTLSEWENKVQTAFTSSGIKSFTYSEALNIAKTGEIKEWDSNKENQIRQEYSNNLNAYNQKVQEATTAWNAYDAAMQNGCTQEQYDLYEALTKNNKFLIQGLLSGYLTLMKDGKEVSLSSSTDILTRYDKSDDAAAEAEYNAQMSKINRKEKVLDNQMKSLDTEHSAMQQEIESVKSIISKHAEKDFNLFA